MHSIESCARYLCGVALIFYGSGALAMEPSQNAERPSTPSKAAHACTSVQSADAVLKCAISRHPAVLRADAALNQAQAKKDWAGQIPNPQLSSDALWGKSLGDTIFEADVSLVQPIELGGKRGARIEQAEAEATLAQAARRLAKERAVVATVERLHRLRQLTEEIHTVDEAIETFKRIVRQYRSQGRLSPEQEASLAVFELSEADFELRRTGLNREQDQLREFFELATGLEFSRILDKLPDTPKSWPEFESTREFKSGEIQLSQAELRTAEAEREVADSLAWPDLSIGPSFGYRFSGGVKFPVYGASVSLTIPLFSQNGGHKTFARQGVIRAEKNLEVTGRELLNERERLLRSYRSAVAALKRSPALTSLRKKHADLEKLFFRGLVSASLVIEAHREILEYLEGLHANELTAIRSTWRLFVLDGRALEEELK